MQVTFLSATAMVHLGPEESPGRYWLGLLTYEYNANPMRFLVLGPLQIDEDGEEIPLGGQRQRAVLALLLLDAGRPVPIDRIVSEIWPDQPLGRVRDSLYTYVSQLRRALGKDRLVRADSGYRLVLTDADEIDAVVFERTVIQAQRLLGADAAAAGRILDLGLGLWRGRPYQGFEDLASLVPEAARLDELHLSAQRIGSRQS